LQPPENLPRVIVVDEPELGLHPKALMDLVGMIDIASESCQIVLSTQSSFLLNFFDVDDVIVVDVENDSTVYKRLDKEELAQWVRDYSLAELWEKNILGGRP
jgi:predicted ATPase